MIGIDATVRMPGETGQVVRAGSSLTEIVEQQEGIEVLGLAEAEGALELHTGAFDGGLCLENFFNRGSDIGSSLSMRGASTRRLVHAFTNCTSSVMVTSSPTRMPPASKAAFHVRP